MTHLSLISDLILVLAAIGVAVYAHRLGRRVRRLADLDTGLGAAIADLSSHVDRLSALHAEIKGGIEAKAAGVADLTAQADERIGRMELLLASLEDLDPAEIGGSGSSGGGGLPRFRHSDRVASEELV